MEEAQNKVGNGIGKEEEGKNGREE